MSNNMMTVMIDEDFAKLWNKTIFGMTRPATPNAYEKMEACYFAWIGWNLHKEYLKNKEMSKELTEIIDNNEGDELQKEVLKINANKMCERPSD